MDVNKLLEVLSSDLEEAKSLKNNAESEKCPYLNNDYLTGRCETLAEVLRYINIELGNYE